MELSPEASLIVQGAMRYAKKHHQELVTPETVLLSMCAFEGFAHSFSECGGNIPTLVLELRQYLKENAGEGKDSDPVFSAMCNLTLSLAAQSALSSGREQVGLSHLLYAMWHIPECYAIYFIRKQGVERSDLLRLLTDTTKEQAGPSIKRPDGKKRPAMAESWKSFCPCLNDTLKDTNPLIGREDETERMLEILCRKDKNNALLIGEPGVGKTAVVFGLVDKLRKGKVPGPAKKFKVFSLDLGGMIAGTQYRGDFEKRFQKALAEVSKEEAPVIFIDEIHNLAGAGATGDGSLDASNMLKPYLAEGKIRFIGATTYEEHKKHFEKNKSLVRRFQKVDIKEPSAEEALAILKGLKKRYEEFHGITYRKGVLKYAVVMSKKYINERCLPDKAIDLLDEAGAYRKLHPLPGDKQVVDKKVIADILTRICRVPIGTVETEEMNGLENLEIRMKEAIFGQNEAVDEVVNAIKFSRAGLSDETKPLASLLFVGPTGVGKTEVAKRLAEVLGSKLIRFDMSEYMEQHAVAKLIGAPAGYVGYEEGGILTEEIRKNPSAVLLLDEIEKAHPDIFHVLLQVMDYATLTDNQGRKADFRNVTIIMTSNAGANRLGKNGIGFASVSQDNQVVMEAVKHTFQPEFRNRLSKIVVFSSMNDAMAELIVEKKLAELSRLLLKKKIRLETDAKARKRIKDRGVSIEFGAREIDRVIRNEIKPLFVDEILFGSLKDGGVIRLSVKDGKFCFDAEGPAAEPVRQKEKKVVSTR